MTSLTKGQPIEITGREPFSGGTQAYSGATFERGVMADGRPVVLKHLPPEGDWLTRATNGSGRARLLFENGVLDRVARTVEHAVVEVGHEDDHDVVVMDDVSDVLLPPDTRLTFGQVDRLLSGLAALHGAFEGCDLEGLCSPAERHSLFIPAFQRGDLGPNPFALRDFIVAGWEVFADRYPSEIVDAIFAIHDDPGLLERELRKTAPWTLLHGDAKLDNLGLRGDRLVAIDWGELTGRGPAEMDLLWLVGGATVVMPGAPTWRIDAMPDEVFSIYENHSKRSLDRRTLDLCCIGMFAQVGWYLGTPMGDSAAQARAAQLDAWWMSRVRAALDVWSPT